MGTGSEKIGKLAQVRRKEEIWESILEQMAFAERQM